jgi:predicted O-methyltransferase YrrM
VSPVPGAFPLDIPGWLLPEEGKKLAELATGKRVLEIGSYCGLSTVCMARTAKHVTAVDYFDGRGTPMPQNTLPAFKRNIERHGLTEKVWFCHPDEKYPFDKYDLAFIDGAHEYGTVKADIERVRSVLAENGLIVFHDYRDPIHDGVTDAVDDLLADGGKLVSLTNTLAVVSVPACIPLEV